MIKNRRILYLGAAIAVLAPIAIFFFLKRPGKKPSTIHAAVEAVETYHEEHGKLPDPYDTPLLTELGITFVDGTVLGYHTIDDKYFLLIKLDNDKPPYWYYNSKTKKWAHGNPPIPE